MKTAFGCQNIIKIGLRLLYFLYIWIFQFFKPQNAKMRSGASRTPILGHNLYFLTKIKVEHSESAWFHIPISLKVWISPMWYVKIITNFVIFFIIFLSNISLGSKPWLQEIRVQSYSRFLQRFGDFLCRTDSRANLSFVIDLAPPKQCVARKPLKKNGLRTNSNLFSKTKSWYWKGWTYFVNLYVKFWGSRSSWSSFKSSCFLYV